MTTTQKNTLATECTNKQTGQHTANSRHMKPLQPFPFDQFFVAVVCRNGFVAPSHVGVSAGHHWRPRAEERICH